MLPLIGREWRNNGNYMNSIRSNVNLRMNTHRKSLVLFFWSTERGGRNSEPGGYVYVGRSITGRSNST